LVLGDVERLGATHALLHRPLLDGFTVSDGLVSLVRLMPLKASGLFKEVVY
jgi:hypothetical protein